jgi:hypothetical protein
MRKLALLALAILPLLGGCVSHVCDVPTAALSWTLQNTAGRPWSCADAKVTYVDVYIGTSFRLLSLPCTDYYAPIDLSGIPPGIYPTTVEGIASDGTTIYDRAQFDLTVAECGGGAYYPVLAEGLLNIDYHFGAPGTPSDVCHSASSSMWFALYDEVAGQMISIIDLSSTSAWKTAYPCGSAIEFSVPFGTYTLDGIQEVTDPLGTPTSIWETCTPTTLDVNQVNVNVLTPPYLQATLPGAPACY